jgi:hypothetical protein
MKLILLSLLTVGAAHAQEPRLATLAQQKMCADQAKRAFDESDASKPLNDKNVRRVSPAEYTSHYDAKANVCYIMVHEISIVDSDDDKRILTSIVVYDAFEGRAYASFMWATQKDKKFWEVPPIECNVKPRGQDEILCKSRDEFEKLVDKHFGIGL